MKTSASAAMQLLLLGHLAAQAQEEQVELEPLPPEVASDFDQRLTNIALQNVDVQQLQGRIDLTEGMLLQVLEIRRDRIWTRDPEARERCRQSQGRRPGCFYIRRIAGRTVVGTGPGSHRCDTKDAEQGGIPDRRSAAPGIRHYGSEAF
jgi:hypothetical protein